MQNKVAREKSWVVKFPEPAEKLLVPGQEGKRKIHQWLIWKKESEDLERQVFYPRPRTGRRNFLAAEVIFTKIQKGK